jgi:Tfp pilus assembly protein PilP
MGQNHGRIISVSDQTIELTEIVPDGLGNYIERSSAVALIE